uniref:Uncharacterized protein n=1 Tax=Caenorhabditis tropicalis TaxID=1561998 RepID=A0A1I7U4A3_9PELO
MYQGWSPYNQQRKDIPPAAPPPIHVPIEPSGQNPQGTMLCSQGTLPNSSWVIWTDLEGIHPQFPCPQIQVANSVDHMRIIETACADLAETTRLKIQKRFIPDPGAPKTFLGPQMLMAG